MELFFSWLVVLYLAYLGYDTDVKFGSIPIQRNFKCVYKYHPCDDWWTDRLKRYLFLPLDGSTGIINNFLRAQERF